MKTFEIAVFLLLAGLVIHVATRKANATNRLSVAKADYFHFINISLPFIFQMVD